jgi:uncharacterized membrane protein HdeD (DUF308 family)
MLVRVGYFFFLVGILVLFVFVASYQVNVPRYNLLLIGLLLVISGVFLVVKKRPPSEDAGRFRRFRRKRSKENQNGDNA